MLVSEEPCKVVNLSVVKTLYRYVDLGLMGTRNHNLPEKLKRNTKAHRIRKNKKKLGRSIARLSVLEELAETLVFYTHPYTSCEKVTNERHNSIIRRFIPKGKRISDFDVDYITDIEIWCNSLPRKILNYRTPDEVFEDELDLIYRQTAS